MKNLLLVTSLVLSTSVFANVPKSQQIKSFTVEEISPRDIYERGIGISKGRGKSVDLDEDTTPVKPSVGDRVESAGKVISTAKDIVALGEAIYDLVQKGKPKNVTEYAPISVVPKDPTTKEYVDPFELEGFSMPVEKSYVAKVVNGVGKEVVNFTYKLMYSYGGSYNGAGKYLTSVIIVPGAVKTTYGWDFNAKMLLSGIMNHGTKADPVVGVMITVKYQMNSWKTSFERNDTIHITGKGETKTYMSK